ncbi:hypothetical protein ACFVYP_00125 [Kitasatospora sp. NPDC058201]|uniref:hypothetical protein n=1 Tax=unclassified Kitasatospora TaxID=2633591 RepID=UPI0036536FDF
MPRYRWVLDTQDDEGRWARHDEAPLPNPLEYDGPPQRAANHLRDVLVRTLSRPAPGPRAIRVRLWDALDPDLDAEPGSVPAAEPRAETEWSRE